MTNETNKNICIIKLRSKQSEEVQGHNKLKAKYKVSSNNM